jgi:hypothetical protein
MDGDLKNLISTLQTADVEAKEKLLNENDN